MKKLLFSLSCFISAFVMQAQSADECGATFIHEQLMATDPTYPQKIAAFEELMLNRASEVLTTFDEPTYVIPVVVHIFHKGEPLGTGTNLSDEEIIKQIEATNQRFRKIAGSVGDGSGVDTGIQLALATRDPDGQCTNGIHRVDLSDNEAYMEYGLSYGNADGLSAADAAALAHWDSTKYYNLYSVSEFSGTTSVGGWSFPASSHGSIGDGARILYNVFRDPFSDTVAHEVGHALNLLHTFEGATLSSCPPQDNGCGSGLGDCCEDTPPQKRGDSCNMETGNSCDNNNPDLTYARNYMGYGDLSCHNAFTANQKSRMVAALTVERASYLEENGNMSLISPEAPQAGFEVASGGISCSAGTIKLLDKSICMPNTFIFNTEMPGSTFLWTISNGSDTYTSTSQNPELTIDEPGLYDVSLTITTAQGSDTHTANDFLVVSGETTAHCTPETLFNAEFDITINKVTFNTISQTTNSRKGGPYIDFVCTDNTVVTAGQTYPLSIFTVANTDDPLTFQVYIDYNNNGTFEFSELVHSGVNTGNWYEVFTTDVTIPEDAVQNTLLTMRVIGNGFESGISIEQVACQMPLFIGDVEDYGVYITGTLGTGEHITAPLTLSPNPVESTFTISGNSQIDTISIYNILGQVVFQKSINGRQPLVNIAHLSAGAYIVHVTAEGKNTTLKVIKQ
jgi:hypothetical protein